VVAGDEFVANMEFEVVLVFPHLDSGRFRGAAERNGQEQRARYE
jgi:hypothetical protein